MRMNVRHVGDGDRRCFVIILGDGGFANFVTELEQFTVDPRCAPEWILPRHSTNQVPDLRGYHRPASSPTLPPPVESPPSPVPGDDGLRLDDGQRTPPVRP